MKRHIQSLVIAVLIGFGSYSGPIFADITSSIAIVPTTEGDNSIVDAIKYYSNLTGADVNQYKLLKLGGIGTLGAFVLGAASAVGAGKVAYENAPGAVKGLMTSWPVASYAPSEGVQKLMTSSALLAGIGSAGAGYMSYKFLNPRIRRGVLAKVQQFIDVCAALDFASKYNRNNSRFDARYNIMSWGFTNVNELQDHLPDGWNGGSDVAIYNALNNLAYQARCAITLLNQIGTDDEVKKAKNLISSYQVVLEKNQKLLRPVITQDQIKAAELANLKADTAMKVAGKWAIYGTMAKGAVENIWKAGQFVYDHKEAIVTSAIVAGVVKAYKDFMSTKK